MENINIEFRKYTADDLVDGVPKAFDNEKAGHASIAMVEACAYLFPYGDTSQKPIFYAKHQNHDKIRFTTFMLPGDDYLDVQTGLHEDDVATKETPMTTPYQKVSDEPLTYGMGTENPFSEILTFEDHSTWKEGDFFEVKAIPFPKAIVDSGEVYSTIAQIAQPCIISGFYDGVPVLGMGNYDRLFTPQDETRDVGEIFSYILNFGHGIREDGKLETYLIGIQENGNRTGFYWLEGEEPIITKDVTMETEWVHLPYVDDRTVTYKDAVFKIGPKTIHSLGKWGAKGITSHPRVERHGQSNVFGKWYEGDKPYEHKLFFHMAENMEAYDSKIEKMGFNIID